MTIFLGSDHGGFYLKEYVCAYLVERGYDVYNGEPFTYNESDDYPELIALTITRLQNADESAVAVIFGRSGNGEAIVANRFKGIRAVCYAGNGLDFLKRSREHNNCNVLSIGSDFVNEKEACEAIETWIHTDFSGDERHKRRIEQIDRLLL